MQKRPTLTLRSKLLNNGSIKQAGPAPDYAKTAVRVPPVLSRINEVLRRRSLTSHG
jgi:hypothetical protein